MTRLRYGLALREGVISSDAAILSALDSWSTESGKAPVYPQLFPVWATLTNGSWEPRFGMMSTTLQADLGARGIRPIVYLQTAPDVAAYKRCQTTDFLPLAQTTTQPLIFRIDHEMNGPWAPWASLGPTVYKTTYRRVVSHIRRYVPNAKFFWCVQALRPADQLRAEMKLWYPGNDVVDFVGFDKYDLGPHQNLKNSWAVPNKMLMELFPDKKRMVGEYSMLEASSVDPASIADTWMRTVRTVENTWGCNYFSIDMAAMNHPTDFRDWTLTSTMKSILKQAMRDSRANLSSVPAG